MNSSAIIAEYKEAIDHKRDSICSAANDVSSCAFDGKLAKRHT